MEMQRWGGWVFPSSLYDWHMGKRKTQESYYVMMVVFHSLRLSLGCNWEMFFSSGKGGERWGKGSSLDGKPAKGSVGGSFSLFHGFFLFRLKYDDVFLNFIFNVSSKKVTFANKQGNDTHTSYLLRPEFVENNSLWTVVVDFEWKKKGPLIVCIKKMQPCQQIDDTMNIIIHI